MKKNVNIEIIRKLQKLYSVIPAPRPAETVTALGGIPQKAVTRLRKCGAGGKRESSKRLVVLNLIQDPVNKSGFRIKSGMTNKRTSVIKKNYK